MKLVHLCAKNGYYQFDLIRFPSGRVVLFERRNGKLQKWATKRGRQAWDAFRQHRWSLGAY